MLTGLFHFPTVISSSKKKGKMPEIKIWTCKNQNAENYNAINNPAKYY